MNSFWSWYIILIVLSNIVGYAILLYKTRKVKPSQMKGNTTGHSFDGIEELDNALPRWWLWLFWISIIFSLIYLALYPGLGNFKGYLNWTSAGQHAEEIQLAKQEYGPIFENYAKTPIENLIQNPEAVDSGQRLFANNCAACHGADARGGAGFPNLTDSDWLYGGDPEAIKVSIRDGRVGMMPPLGTVLGEEGLKAVIQYIFSLGNRKHDAELAKAGQEKFSMLCVACHGQDATGNYQFGAPNLTDNIWLYGGSPLLIEDTISNGRNGNMPAHKSLLTDAEIHVVAAYVYSLSQKKQSKEK